MIARNVCLRAAALCAIAAALVACNMDGRPILTLQRAPERPIDEIAQRKTPVTATAEAREKDLRTVMLSNAGMMDEPTLEGYVNRVLQRLLAASPRKAPDARVYLLADASPGAFAYGSGAIFISQGILRELRNEDELAFILGHELGHVLLEHTQEDFLLKTQRYALMLAETGMAVQQQFNQGQSTGKYGWLIGGYASTIVTRDMLSPSRSREEEDRADRMGIDLMVAANYNPSAAVDAMALLVQAEQDFGRQDDVSLTTLEEAVQEQFGEGQGRAARNPGLIDSAFRELVKGIGKAQSEMRREHRPATERQAMLSSYIDASYADAPEPAYAAVALRQALDTPPTRALLDQYRKAAGLDDMVKGLRERGLSPREQRDRTARLTAALRELQQPPGAQDPNIRLFLAHAHKEMGNRNLWRQELARSIESPRASYSNFARYAEAETTIGGSAKGLEVLQQAYTRFKEPPSMLPELIAAHSRAGRREEAGALALRCRLTAPELANVCAKNSERP